MVEGTGRVFLYNETGKDRDGKLKTFWVYKEGNTFYVSDGNEAHHVPRHGSVEGTISSVFGVTDVEIKPPGWPHQDDRPPEPE